MAKSKETKQERSWIFYDWANSVYATIIMAAIYPIYFAAVVPDGDVWWGYGTSIATFTVALLAPVLGAVADYKGMKKKLFTFFLLLGVVFTSVMAISDNWKLMLVGYIFSYIGFSGSCLFYDSFLTDVTTPERMDAVSAKGYAMGYIGGSTIPFLLAIALMMLVLPDNTALAVKLSVVLTSVWWLVFSIPMLKNVEQTHSLGEIPPHFIRTTLKNVLHTFVQITRDKAILLFMIAYFFYIDGVGTVIHMSTAYGSTLGLGTTGMILALLVTQLVAAPCSIWFSKLSAKIGSIKMIGIAIIVYFIICSVGFYMGFSLEAVQTPYSDCFGQAYSTLSPKAADALRLLEDNGIAVLSSDTRAADFEELADRALAEADPAVSAELKTVLPGVRTAVAEVLGSGDFELSYTRALGRSSMLFWMMAVLVGTCQGGIQALSRSFFGKLIPPEKSNEFFGFFDIFGKFAAVMGPALYAVIKSATGRSSFGILSLMLLFAIGGAVLLIGRRHFSELEKRAR